MEGCDMAKRNGFRKRFLVTEGDLFQLFAQIQEVRSAEKREIFMGQFRQLLKEAERVKLVIEK